MGRPRTEWDPTAEGPYSARDRDIGRDSRDSGQDDRGRDSRDARPWTTWGAEWDDDEEEDDNHTWNDGPHGREYRRKRGW